MTDPKDQKRWAFDPTFNIGTMVHLIVLLAALAIAWGKFDTRMTLLENQFAQFQLTVGEVRRQTNREEHYLESRDPNYWKIAKDNGDGTP